VKANSEPEQKTNHQEEAAGVEQRERTTTNELDSSASRSRRAFLSKVTAATIAVGFIGVPSLMKLQQAAAQTTTDCPAGCELGPLMGVARADTARQRRVKAADCQRAKPIPSHPCNGDEVLYSTRNYIASYTKGLPHIYEKFGEVDSAAYCVLLRAIHSGNPADFELIPLGCVPCSGDVGVEATEGRTGGVDTGLPSGVSDEASRGAAPEPSEIARQRRLESPQAGYNFDTEGIDYHQAINRPSSSTTPIAFPPAFTFSSNEEAVEIIENYWQALTRDVPFREYTTNSLVATAAADINQFGLLYKGPREGGQVTPRVYSRGILPGDTIGPFLSQYMLLDIPYGAQMIDPRIQTVLPIDFMTNFDEWFRIQNGCTPTGRATPSNKVFIRNGRDLGQYVRNDPIYQAYLNAALILMTPPSMGGLGAPLDPNNPYLSSCTQLNFVEFGISQLLTLIGEVSVRAHKAVWYQKWQVHRRLRPEEFGGRVHFWKTGQRDRYPISNLLDYTQALPLTFSKFGSYFLPQAYQEGSPLHPAYGAGHATLAGACVTILKAWFNEAVRIIDLTTPVEATSDGSARTAYTGSDASLMTVGSELNKLASNISIGRDIAGVHWRSDYTESVYLGEQIAINLLRDYGFTYNENFSGFNLTNFYGNQQVVGGKVTTTCPQ
jgi:hypothetical protein